MIQEVKSITTFFLLSEAERNALCASKKGIEKPNFIENEHMKIVDGVLVKYTEEPGMTEVVIPKGVTSIGKRAFFWCEFLTDIDIPESVTTIGDGVFDCCKSLTSIEVSSNNSKYASSGGVLFDKNFSRLIRCPEGKSGSYTLPKNVMEIGHDAFIDCINLTSITIPESVTTIGTYAFRNCELTSIIIPKSVTSIGDGVFFGCRLLTNIDIPESVTTIGDGVFDCCKSLTSIEVSSNNSKYASSGGVLFDKNFSRLIRCPEGKSGSYTLPKNVMEIGHDAFIDCINLTSITIPESVTTIGTYAFHKCEKLTSIIIPKSVTSIVDGVFDYCKSLTSIEVSSNNSKYASSGGVLFDKNFSRLIRCPEGKSGSYTLPKNVMEIGHDAFLNCRNLTSITIPKGVTSIGDEAFKNCENLTQITIPDSVRCAFPYCLDLTQNVTVIILPKDCKVADSAFDKYIHDHKVEHTYKVAEALFKTRNYTEAVKCYQEVVEQTYTVGKCVYDTIEKRKIMFHHVESVYPMAQCCLGYCYYKGKGVKKDYEKAVYWFEKAKPWIRGMGSEVACPICRVMSKCYKKGRGVLKDLNKAKEWESIFLVAHINGKVVAKKETEAIDFSKLK